LAEAIDWEFFEREFGSLYVEQKGRPGLPMRLQKRFRDGDRNWRRLHVCFV
jgi:IS5 family transposase